MELKNKKIVFLGDSITRGQGASDPSLGYVNQFAAMTGAQVVNYGIGGTRIARRLTPHEVEQFNHDFCGRFHLMDDDADMVVVFGGTNDFGGVEPTPLGQLEDRDLCTFYGACHYLFSGLIAKYPDKPIIVMTPMHRVADWDKTPALRDYVRVIREVAEYYSLPVLDLWATLGICPLVPEHKALYMLDNVHPNDAGHQKIAYTLKRFLENM